MEEETDLTEEFRDEAIKAVMSLGLPEDEAEREVDNYYGQF